MSVTAAVVVFPGSNCDEDCRHVLADVVGVSTQMVWHKETRLPEVDIVVLPGGFSYGDYLRSGAIARFSPIMADVVRHAERGGLTFGICNGFQVLTEVGLLPGALRHNAGLKFVCQDTTIRVVHSDTALTSAVSVNEDLVIPVAHNEGCYVLDEDGLARLEGEGQVLFRYVDPDGEVAERAAINGSFGAIAGICNRGRNVFGMMPHPERCSEALVGGPAYGRQNTDGLALFEGLVSAAQGGGL